MWCPKGAIIFFPLVHQKTKKSDEEAKVELEKYAADFAMAWYNDHGKKRVLRITWMMAWMKQKPCDFAKTVAFVSLVTIFVCS